MTEQAQVGDTVRLTIVVEGQVNAEFGGLYVLGIGLDAPDRTYKILSRAPLPSEPGTFWLDVDDDLWRVNPEGLLVCITEPGVDFPEIYTPFRQLVLKND